MLRMKGRPSIGAFLRSSVQATHRGWISSPGLGKPLAMRPSNTPLWSTNRNQPTGLPVLSSVFCHRPATVGSAARAGPATKLNAVRAAIAAIVAWPFNPNILIESPQVSVGPRRSVVSELFTFIAFHVHCRWIGRRATAPALFQTHLHTHHGV